MTCTQLQALAAVWLALDEPVMEVQVLDHKGSVPRETGARMLVRPSDTAGTIGGGHLEWKAIEAARGFLSLGANEPHDLTYALGPSLGQCCGGVVTLRIALLTPERLEAWPNAKPRFYLQLFGAGHVGCAIARLLEDIDCAVQWFDERGEQFPTTAPVAHIERIAGDDIAAEVQAAPPNAAYLIATHSHELDYRITEAALRRHDAAYVGLIGSATKRERFLHRMTSKGATPEALARLSCPIGLPGIEGKEPEIIAIAVVAQLLLAAP